MPDVEATLKELGIALQAPRQREATNPLVSAVRVGNLVANGCSEVFVKLWGEEGKHCRSAVGMASLPGNAAVEVEAIVEIA